jgi:hypothetical protein
MREALCSSSKRALHVQKKANFAIKILFFNPKTNFNILRNNYRQLMNTLATVGFQPQSSYMTSITSFIDTRMLNI